MYVLRDINIVDFDIKCSFLYWTGNWNVKILYGVDM